MFYLLSLAGIILVVLYYRNTVPHIRSNQKLLLIILRSISLILILLLFLNPILHLINSKLKKPEVLILNDISDSMFLSSRDSTKSERLANFKETIEQKYSTADYDVKKKDFAKGLSGNSSSTDLLVTMNQIIKEEDISELKKIFLFSDGWFHDENLNSIKDFGIPVYTFDPEFSSSEFDLSIVNLKFNRTSFVNELNSFIVEIRSDNYSGKADLEFYADGQLISTRSIELDVDQLQQIFLEHSFDETGLIPLEFKVIPETEGEINSSNNSYPAAAKVLKDKAKILFISDKLTWDVKFLLDALKENERWQTEFLQKGQYLKLKDRNVELLSRMDNAVVIVLINNANLRLSSTEQELIQNHVAKGGGLFSMGKPIAGLAELMPVTFSGIDRLFSSTLYFTKASQKYETFNFSHTGRDKEIPPVDYFYVEAKLQAEILAGLNNEERTPAIIFSEMGKGKVIYFSFLNLWKWQLRQDDNSYRKFINDISDWLAEDNSGRFMASTRKNSYFTGENVRVDLQAFDEKLNFIADLNAKLEIKDDMDKIVEAEYMQSGDEKYFLILKDLPHGHYSYYVTDEQRALTASGEFIVTRDNPENRDVDFNIPLLSYISQSSGGKLYGRNDLAKIEIPLEQAIKVELRSEIPIYKKWYLITLFLISFCLEIYLRKRWGLL